MLFVWDEATSIIFTINVMKVGKNTYTIFTFSFHVIMKRNSHLKAMQPNTVALQWTKPSLRLYTVLCWLYFGRGVKHGAWKKLQHFELLIIWPFLTMALATGLTFKYFFLQWFQANVSIVNMCCFSLSYVVVNIRFGQNTWNKTSSWISEG